jgi:endonuclease/exonuclease/phosphatase (EEP) superfamily protein YafD
LEAVLNKQTGIDLSRVAELEAVVRLRANESAKVSRWIAGFSGPKIVMGDFNMPIESRIWRRDWADLADSFSAAGCGFGFTKISEKRGWSYGARIDHVLSSPPWLCQTCLVAGDIGSDHLPLIALFSCN